MSEVIEQESTELVTLPSVDTALAVYSTAGGLEPYLQQIKAEIDAFVPDTKTAKGRAAIASMAFKVAKIKTAIEGLGKTVSAELKEIPKKVDAERKRTREKLELWQAEVRKPLTDWEEAEESRVALLNAAVMRLNQFSANASPHLEADVLRSMLAEATDTIVDGAWDEFETEAHRAKEKAVNALTDALAASEKYEAEQEELARLRAESEARAKRDEEERIAREAAEAATKAAEAKAQAERDAAAKAAAEAKAAADRRELELKLKAETAERERLEAVQKAERDAKGAIERQRQAEERAKAEAIAAAERATQAAEAARLAEVKRQADETARIEAEAKKREADTAHKRKVNQAALKAFITGGMPEECAKQAITLIAMGKIPAIRISY